MPWYIYKKKCENGRHWVLCAVQPEDHQFWLNHAEMLAWESCPHCLNWWDLSEKEKTPTEDDDEGLD